MSMDIFSDHIVVTLGRKSASVPVEHQPEGEDGPDLLVHLDDLTHWRAPDDAEEVSLDDLAKLAELIERHCDKLGVDVEFE